MALTANTLHWVEIVEILSLVKIVDQKCIKFRWAKRIKQLPLIKNFLRFLKFMAEKIQLQEDKDVINLGDGLIKEATVVA